MADAVTICNMALSHIGEEATVVSVNPEEASEESNVCATFYPRALLALLDAHDWSFATRKTVLAELATNNKFGWKYAYAMPSECLRILRVQTEDATHQPITMRMYETPLDWPFEVVNIDRTQLILTDCDNAVATYVTSQVEEGRFTPLFVEALSWLLASYLAGARIKGRESAEIARYCLQQYTGFLSSARRQDSTQMRNFMGYMPKWVWDR